MRGILLILLLPGINGPLHFLLFGGPHDIELIDHIEYVETPFRLALFDWHDHTCILIQVRVALPEKSVFTRKV